MATASTLANRLEACVRTLKVGSQLFVAEGPRAVERLARMGFGIFLDLKFHDIPNTVARAVAAAAKLPGVHLMTLHTSGGLEMMKAAREAIGGMRNPPALLGVTLLTSMDAQDLRQVGLAGSPAKRGIKLAALALKAGLDGVVASALEVAAIRNACGRRFLVVVPGIRPGVSSADDQARVGTPAAAIRAGADYLVVGRPITGARDPARAARAILSEIASTTPRS